MDATIEQIESMTAQDVYEMLKSAGIKRNSRNLRDYIRAKDIVFRGKWIDENKYDHMVQWITGYLNV